MTHFVQSPLVAASLVTGLQTGSGRDFLSLTYIDAVACYFSEAHALGRSDRSSRLDLGELAERACRDIEAD
jgi:hypothetical protein